MYSIRSTKLFVECKMKSNIKYLCNNNQLKKFYESVKCCKHYTDQCIIIYIRKSRLKCKD